MKINELPFQPVIGSIYVRINSEYGKSTDVVGHVDRIITDDDGNAHYEVVEIVDRYGETRIERKRYAADADLAFRTASTGEIDTILGTLLMQARQRHETRLTDAVRAADIVHVLEDVMTANQAVTA